MAFFFCRLIAPRPTFAFDMDDEERALMGAHGAYLRGYGEQGKAIVFGPVADPAGPWGLAVLQVADETELKTILDNDPTVLSGRGFRYEALPMIQAVLGRDAFPARVKAEIEALKPSNSN